MTACAGSWNAPACRPGPSGCSSASSPAATLVASLIDTLPTGNLAPGRPRHERPFGAPGRRCSDRLHLVRLLRFMPITVTLWLVTGAASAISNWYLPTPNCTAELAAVLVVQLTKHDSTLFGFGSILETGQGQRPGAGAAGSGGAGASGGTAASGRARRGRSRHRPFPRHFPRLFRRRRPSRRSRLRWRRFRWFPRCPRSNRLSPRRRPSRPRRS